MAEVRWTEEAAEWLENIYDYICENDRDAAGRVVDGIYRKAQLLVDFPQIGYLYSSVKNGEVRILLYGHYRIAYLLHSNGRYIDILGIFHGSLNIKRFLK